MIYSWVLSRKYRRGRLCRPRDRNILWEASTTKKPNKYPTTLTATLTIEKSQLLSCIRRRRKMRKSKKEEHAVEYEIKEGKMSFIVECLYNIKDKLLYKSWGKRINRKNPRTKGIRHFGPSWEKKDNCSSNTRKIKNLNTSSMMPVSYTHLTLPTICSV